MTEDPESLPEDAEIAWAVNRMSLGGFRHVPLVDGNGRPVGILSVKDVVNYLAEFFPDAVQNIPPRPASTCRRHPKARNEEVAAASGPRRRRS